MAVVGLGAVLAAEAAAWLLSPGGTGLDPVAASENAYFAPAQLRRVADFSGPQRWIGLGSLALELAVLAALAIWRPQRLRRRLDAAGRRPLLGGAAVGAAISLTLAVIGAPLTAVAHQRAIDFGLSTQGFDGWLGDRAISAAIAAGLAALAGAAAMLAVRRLGGRFWIGGTVIVIGWAVVSTWLAPVLLAPVFNRFEPLPDGRLRDEVLALGTRADVDIGDVYRVDASRRSTTINAYVDGIGPTKRVVLYDNAIRELSPAELRSVVAHELGHVRSDDILRGIGYVALVAPLGMLFVQLAARELVRRSGDDVRSPGSIPALALAVSVAVLVLSVPGNQLSRQIEAGADAFALRLTGDPDALIGLQRRFGIVNLSDPRPPAVNHFLFGTHPTTMERIGAALAFRREQRAEDPEPAP